MTTTHLQHKFLRRVAFGLAPGQDTPSDPLTWAIDQMQVSQPPAIDILEKDGRRRDDLPEWVRLMRSMDEVMHAFHTHQVIERRSFEQGKSLSRKDFEDLRQRELGIPYWQTEHWKEVQARATTALYGQSPVFERFWHFWTNHFMVAPGNQNNDTLVGPYQRSLRDHMSGTFRDLLWHAVTHPGMLVYLDNNANTGPRSKAAREKWTKNSINENLGRELLELFTLSPAAGYTQADVEATTLILTGWRDMKPDQNRPAGTPLGTFFDFNHHEPGSQTVLGKSYSALFRPSSKLEDLVTDLAKHPATARHLARKLCVYFLDDEPPAEAVQAVEQAFVRSGGQLRAVHQAVIQAAWDHLATTRKFLSPETWYLQTLKLSDLEPPRTSTVKSGPGLRTHYLLGDLGQPLPRCPQPNGWPIRSSEWISKEMLDRRARVLQVLHRDFRLMRHIDYDDYFARHADRFLPDDGPDTELIRAAVKRNDYRLAYVAFHASPSLLWS
jgi:uncharacterized protein (DUF1800 family)